MKTRKILFIVEGKYSEPELIDAIYDKCFADEDYDIFPYKTNIHDLVERIYSSEVLDDGFDVVLYLREIVRGTPDAQILNNRFSDVFLVFDFDPQDNRFNAERLKELQAFFNDSTENGKLYINYPCHESYKHIDTMPDINFENKTVPFSVLTSYKELVSNETPYYTDVKKYDKKIIFSLAAHHLKKFNKLLHNNGQYVLVNGEITSEELSDLLEMQTEHLKNNQAVYVLSTLMLHIFEYQPTKIIGILPDVANGLI